MRPHPLQFEIKMISIREETLWRVLIILALSISLIVVLSLHSGHHVQTHNAFQSTASPTVGLTIGSAGSQDGHEATGRSHMDQAPSHQPIATQANP